MKLIILVSSIFIALFSMVVVLAENRPTAYSTTNNYEINNYYSLNGSSDDLDDAVTTGSEGIAIGIASNHPFDYATKKWQASVNASRFGGMTGLSFGIGKKFDNMDALFHSSYGKSGDSEAFTGGVLWRF